MSSDQQKAVRELVQRMLAETGLTLTELARRAGVSSTTLTRFMNKDVKHTLSMSTLGKLSVASGVGVPMGISLPGAAVAAPRPAEALVVPRRGEMAQDLPVYGTAQGANGEGAFIINMGGQVDRIRRPPGLAANRDAFAIYVEGDSMEPRFEPGEVVVVDPNRPVRPGDDVVLLLESPEPGRPPKAYIKRLVRRGAERILVKQYNPPREMEFPTAAVQKIFRVMRVGELLG
ncbi:MAG TPA: S24 family peptidase [Roseomonas sp.]